ncbi:uncharacterized protein LOC105933913 [Fundulus heteroclitus]|uniref:uncharacterized protein LOC105933913 n=1 Tax=Fundulus heteroclitus TaxID=8078 RepID=UPI00165C5663|nr:uncharacterized protein LOC105933913 [Fundulus heteroclitus]
MIQPKFSQEVLTKSEDPVQEEIMLTTHDKNGGLYLTGHSIKQATNNSHNWTTPGLHMSGTHGQESVGQLATSSPTQEGMAQLGSLALKPPRHDSERLAEDQPPRRPLKLTPLELPEEVREAQRKKLNLIYQDAKRAACKLDIRLNSNAMCKPKPIVRQKLVKAVMSPSASTVPVKTAPRQKSPRPQLARSDPVEKQLQDVACRAIQASVRDKAAPPLLPAAIKAEAACDGEASRKNPTALRPVAERRRLRMRREKCLEEDQCQSNTSPGRLSTDGGRFTQGVRGKGQQTEWCL